MKRRALKFTVILLALSCSETEFDAELKEKETASNNTGDATNQVIASGMPPTETDSDKQTDTFEPERDKGLLDLLLVIDDSESMEKVHEKLENRLSNLLTNIDNSNWQIKIVDADLNKKCDQPIITRTNKDVYKTRLDNLVTDGSSQERTLQKARAALRLSPYENVCPAWLRASSTLAAVIVTNDNHQCDNPSAPDIRGNGDTNSYRCDSQDSVRDFITEFRGIRTNTRLYGILDTEDTCSGLPDFLKNNRPKVPHECGKIIVRIPLSLCPFTNPCYDRSSNYKFRSASYLAEKSEFDNILHLHEDESKYENFLEQISSSIKEVLQDQFTLTKEPKAGTVTVTVDGSSNIGFTISGKILTFTSSLPEGAKKITVTYVPKAP